MSAVVTDHLPLLAGAPTGIKKLRELILELAVRGKLVPQDESDEPASELLKRIAEKRMRLVAKGTIRKQTSSTIRAEQEEPFALPLGWEWTRLGQLGLIGSSSRVHQKDWQSSGVPFYRAREIVRLSKDGLVDNELYISEDLFKELSSNGLVPAEGDIMITGVGTIGIPYRVRSVDRFYFKDASVLIFKNYALINVSYLLKYLASPFWTSAIHEESMGTTVHTLTIARATETLCPLPPVAEQHRIVAKVDELMALCDRLEARQADAESAHNQLVEALLGSLTQARDANDFATSWQRLSQHFHTLFTTESSIDALKQAVLQLAVRGKLVHQRLDSPEVQTKVPVAEGKTGPFLLPTGWLWVRLSDIEPEFQNGASSRGDSEGESVTVLRLADIKSGEVCLGDTRDLKLSQASISKHALEDGDVLIIRVNGSADLVGRFVVFRTASKVIPCDHFIRMRFVEGVVVPEYLKIVGDSELTRGAIAGLFVSTAGQKTVNQGHVRSLLLPFPPLAEQHRIVAKVGQLMAFCDQLKSRISTAEELSRTLATALISDALEGKSTPSTYREKGGEVIHLASYLVANMHRNQTFGRVALMKAIYLVDNHLRLNLIEHYERKAAGPFDDVVYEAERSAARQGWFSCAETPLKSGESRFAYNAGKNIAQATDAFLDAIGDFRPELDRLIGLLAGKKTDDVEVIATLHAVWSDALAKGVAIDDDMLVDQFRNNWHEKKQRFTPKELKYWLSWMRENQLVPIRKSLYSGMQNSLPFT